MHQLRVCVVDDSLVSRSLVIEAINSLSIARVISFAPNGKLAIDKIGVEHPDVVTLDIEMPELNGIETLKIIKEKFPEVSVIMVSSFTKERSQVTIDALSLGAHSFITKPEKSTIEENREVVRKEISQLLEAILQSKNSIVEKASTTSLVQTNSIPASRPEIICIGSSTGGPKTLMDIIPHLPADLRVPICIVQHMPPMFTGSLAVSLNQKSSLTVCEAQDGMVIQAGFVYVAAGGFHMKVTTQTGSNKKVIKLTEDPPENFCRPAIDYLFRSISLEYKEKALGIILTGMGKDGTLGLKVMKKFGAATIGQDAQSCIVYGMPQEAKKAGVIDIVCTPKEIVNEIIIRVKS